MKKSAHFLALLLLATGFLFAAPAAEAAKPVAKSPSMTRQFIQKATIGNGFEILSSRIALDRSRNPEVRDFAQRMIEAHNSADDQLRDAVRHSGYRMTNMPNDLDAKHRSMVHQLESTPPGEDFDRLYISLQKQAHNDAVKLYSKYARQGGNPVLREFASNLLPEINEHRDHVREVRFYR